MKNTIYWRTLLRCDLFRRHMNPLWSSIHKQPAMRGEKNRRGKKWKVLQQQENSYESTFLVNPGLDNEGWDKTVYFKICNLTSKSGTLLKVCFILIEMESSGVDLGMFISKRKKTVSSPRSSFLFSVYQLEIWLEIYATARYVLRYGDICKISLE